MRGERSASFPLAHPGARDQKRRAGLRRRVAPRATVIEMSHTEERQGRTNEQLRRDTFHVREGLAGRCPHRKYGVVYDTYSTMKPFWEVCVFGRWVRLSFFRLLRECDMCHRQLIRWPSWEPPTDPAVPSWVPPGGSTE